MVERFTVKGWNDDHIEVEDPVGKWVQYSDYAELKAENERQATSIEILRRHAFEWKDRAVAAEAALSALEPAAPEGQQPVAYRVHVPEDEHYGTGPDRLQFHSLAQYDLDNGYRQTPLYTRPSEQAEPEGQQEPVAWPPLVQMGRTIGLFASAIKSGEAWSSTLQTECDAANVAMKSLWGDITRPSEQQEAEALTYGQKLIAEAIEHHFGERNEQYDEDVDDTTVHDAWEAFDALTCPSEQAVTEVMVEAFQEKYREFWKGSWPDSESSRELLKAAMEAGR